MRIWVSIEPCRFHGLLASPSDNNDLRLLSQQLIAGFESKAQPEVDISRQLSGSERNYIQLSTTAMLVAS